MPVSVGLEIGTTAVRAALLDPRSQPPRLLAAVSVPWGGTSGDELLRAIQQARKTLPITSPVVLGLPTTVAIVTTVQPLVVNRIRTDLAVRFELQQHLPYDAAQTAWHYQWLSLNPPAGGVAGASSPAGGIGGVAVVAAVKQSVLQERLTMCRRTGVAVKSVQINALAVANAWLRSAPTAVGAGLVVRLDGRVLEWIIIASNGLYVFPNFLPAPRQQSGPLPATLPTPLPAASREISPTAVGAHAGASLIRAGLAQADHDQLRALFKTSWEGLQKHLESTAVTLPPGPSVWLIGGSSSYPQLGEDLQRAIGCAVQPLSIDMIARVPTNVGTDDFVATCALSLQGAGATRISLNLVSQMSRARRVARLRRGSGLIGLMSVLLAALWSVQGILTSLRSREAVLEHSRQQEQSYQLLRPEVRAIRRHQAHLEYRLKQLEYLARTHDRMTRSFVQITEALPDSLWLTTLDLTKNIPQMTGTLEGYAQSFQGVTQYIDRLKAVPEWITVKPQATNVTIDPTTRAEVVAFAIQVQRVLEVSSAKDESEDGSKPEKTPESSKKSKKTGSAKSQRKK